jgi:hypothetical protein
MNGASDGPVRGYGSIKKFIVAFVVVEVITDDGSNKKVANMLLCAFVRVTRG